MIEVNINDLYKLEKKDINKSAEVLSDAFYDYPVFKHILGKRHNKENINIITKFIIKYAILYGEAYASSHQMEGIILFSDFKDYKFTLFRALRCGALSLIRLGKESAKRFNEYDELNLKIHKKNIKEPHQYVIGIGVNPKKQGQAFGRKLLTSFIKVAEEKNQPCYLETHGEKNVAIYEKYGFKVVSRDVLPGTDIVQFGMLKR